ncbi:uncharacterized protein LOC111714193 [Eurytemora carolleeae]|uniref:uncharacterized protein LOC111714193 n=1 Tax=Eurytemora carolleeae TaxID=1294199 RepID=UPI000C774E23|nr:uncharacterized protein LOC111714193 [Eurytemora carolleeae]|eukprot:XP_023345011.1 uncharacterized protein LOC111714193 [Eurytemora affinis]
MKICKFYQNGRCWRERACPFKHQYKNQENRRGTYAHNKSRSTDYDKGWNHSYDEAVKEETSSQNKATFQNDSLITRREYSKTISPDSRNTKWIDQRETPEFSDRKQDNRRGVATRSRKTKGEVESYGDERCMIGTVKKSSSIQPEISYK